MTKWSQSETWSQPVFGFFLTADHKEEDVARALLNFFCHDFAYQAHVCALMEECKHIFFCGSGINSALVRSELTSEMTVRMCRQCVFNGKVPVIMFLQV